MIFFANNCDRGLARRCEPNLNVRPSHEAPQSFEIHSIVSLTLQGGLPVFGFQLPR